MDLVSKNNISRRKTFVKPTKNTFEGGPLVFLCVVKYKHMKFRKKIERHFFYDIDDDDDDDDESSHVKVSI